MTEFLAKAIAEELGGKAHHTGGNLWVVEFDRADGSLVVLGDMGAFQYRHRTHWDESDDGDEVARILFDLD